jgi:DNA-binding NarL/FixJ family response regulator
VKAELLRTRGTLAGREELQATIHDLETARRDGQSICDQRTAIGEDLKGRNAHADIELTARQWDILQLISGGCSLKEIAHVLSISLKTVEFHKYSMMQKLGFRITAELIKYYMHRRLATNDAPAGAGGSFTPRRQRRHRYILPAKTGAQAEIWPSRCGFGVL